MTNLLISWLNGISALLLIITAWILVIYCVYYYRKLKVKTYFGGLLLFGAIGLGWMGITLSFLSIELTGINQPWVIEIVPYFSYSTLPIGCFAIIYIVWELVGTKKSKNFIYILYFVLSIIYYILLYIWMDINVLTNFGLYGDATTLIDDWVNPTAPFYYFIWLLTLITGFIMFIGFGKMMLHTAGDLKARSSLIVIFTPIFAFCILADTVILGSFPLIPSPITLIFSLS